MVFDYPSIYNFPPFFTKQPNETVFKSQLEKWGEIIVQYCEAGKIWKLDKDDGIFNNKEIDRKASEELVGDIFQYLQDSGKLGMDGWMWWKSDEEWAEMVRLWVDGNGLVGTVMTLEEIGEELGGMPVEMVGRVVELLQGEGFCVAMQGGVKF